MLGDHVIKPIVFPPGDLVALVCGGRHYGATWDEERLYWKVNNDERIFLDMTLTDLHARRGFTLIIHGAASGADVLGEAWALRSAIRAQAFPADWKRLKKGAGHARNVQMLVEGKPRLLIAFKGDSGTRMMVDLARKAQVEVLTPGWSY